MLSLDALIQFFLLRNNVYTTVVEFHIKFPEVAHDDAFGFDTRVQDGCYGLDFPAHISHSVLIGYDEQK